jgi:ABC-type transport system involved in cytochrome bd biosynthesis fused ATPase/permease subunit
MLDSGRIAEEGTHGELMAAGGLYAKLFDIQAHYYKEKPKDTEAESQ